MNGPSTLKRIELAGNKLGEIGCQAIGYGMERFNGELDYIGKHTHFVWKIHLQLIIKFAVI